MPKHSKSQDTNWFGDFIGTFEDIDVWVDLKTFPSHPELLLIYSDEEEDIAMADEVIVPRTALAALRVRGLL